MGRRILISGATGFIGRVLAAALAGQRVLPSRLLAAGFDFRHPDAPSAVAAILR